MQLGLPYVRLPLGTPLNLFTQSLKLSTADVLQVCALRARCRGLIEKYRNAITRPYFFARALRERHAILHRDALYRNKRHYVRSANPWVCARMFREIDQLQSFANAQHS